MKKQLLALAAVAVSAFGLQAQTVSSFEEIRIPAQGFLNGKPVNTRGRVESGGISFNNDYSTAFNYWSGGFAVTNQRNDTASGLAGMYSAVTAAGVNSQNYAVGQNNAKISIPRNKNVHGVYITNSTYAYMSMENGDQFAKKFGGTTGSDPDFFRLTVTGYVNGTLKDTSVEFLLADYTFSNNAEDYKVNTWEWVDLSALEDADSLVFGLESSDVGQFGMNTPGFFCIDNFSVKDTGISQAVTAATFEDVQLALDSFWNGEPKPVLAGFQSGNAFFNTAYNNTYNYWSTGFALSNVIDVTTAGSTNQYAAIAGGGFNSSQYAVATGGARVRLTGNAAGKGVQGFYITNSTYAYMSMKNGDQFAKKFGGASGSDPDFFEVIVRGHRNGAVADSVIVALADFRSASQSEDYILDTWRWVDLLPLGDIDSLSFAFASSDVGQFGINTPRYFCMDYFTTKDAPVPTIVPGNVAATICAGTGIGLSFTVSEMLGSNNVFTAQLSDAAGSFAAPVQVGTLTATGSGSIQVAIPAGTAAGSGYKLRVVASDPAITSTASDSFAIGARPVIAAITGNDAPVVNEEETYSVPARTGSSYAWSFTSGTGSGTTNEIDITWNQVGNITLKVVETTAEGCVSDTAALDISVKNPVGLKNAAAALQASVYPNPAGSTVYFTLPEGSVTASVVLHDAAGRLVLTSESMEPLDVQHLERGIYFMTITSGGKSATKRLILN